MPKYKNIRTKSGLRRVRVLANGQYRFVSNKAGRKRSRPSYHRPKRRRARPFRKQSRSRSRSRRNRSNRSGGFF